VLFGLIFVRVHVAEVLGKRVLVVLLLHAGTVRKRLLVGIYRVADVAAARARGNVAAPM
jgi:hypothetical protein